MSNAFDNIPTKPLLEPLDFTKTRGSDLDEARANAVQQGYVEADIRKALFVILPIVFFGLRADFFSLSRVVINTASLLSGPSLFLWEFSHLHRSAPPA